MKQLVSYILPFFFLLPAVNFQQKAIVYFSQDNGNTWQDKSTGLPAPVVLTDFAVSGDVLAVASKQKGIYRYDFSANKWARTTSSPATANDLDALLIRNNIFFVGTHGDGIFRSADNGKTWLAMNVGLGNLTVRKLADVDGVLYAGTNGGLYSYWEKDHKWVLEPGSSAMQVNGIASLDGEIFIGTNKGVLKSIKGLSNWINVLPDRSLHNISADDKRVYAMVYSELFVSADKGKSWQSDQKGMPPGMYSFHVVPKDNTLFVGQWDGIYRKSAGGLTWTSANNGLPVKFPVTELKVFKNLLIAGSSGWVNK
jgi:photosystem II stability/assembly factor-like uncharacterized protein